MENNLKKTFWGDAAKAGLIIGLVMFVFDWISIVIGKSGAGWIFSLLRIVIIVALIYWFGKKRSVKYGAAGYEYGQSMGYIVSMMLFAGFIYGVGLYLLMNFIAPDYYAGLYESFEISGMEDYTETVKVFMRNPVFLIFAGIFTMVIYGGLIGLIVSAFVRRKPDIFSENNI